MRVLCPNLLYIWICNYDKSVLELNTTGPDKSALQGWYTLQEVIVWKKHLTHRQPDVRQKNVIRYTAADWVRNSVLTSTS